jgi:2-iminobutanoate/2-iminopropanoate deaminase
MARQVISSDNAPKAIGPYSQAIKVPAGEMLFLSGQIPLDPQTGELVKGDITDQIVRVMENLKAVLTAGGMDFSNVVRSTMYLMDLNDFAKVNEVYSRYFPSAPPARVTIQIAGLPKGSRVEVDAIAVKG